MPIKPVRTALAALAIVTGATAPALSQEPGPGSRALLGLVFTNADANKDNRVDAGELLAFRMRGFDRADADGDGVLTAAERAAAMERAQRRARQMQLAGESQFDRFDADGDGRVTRSEFETGATPVLDLIDANGDGAIDRGEFNRLTEIVGSLR